MTHQIRVVVVDDSAMSRRFIASMLEQDPLIRVVGEAADGRQAIAMVQELRPDVVTMDVRMPVMDGLATTEHLMAFCPTPILVLTASLVGNEVDITFKMLGAGALEVVEKPSAANTLSYERASRDLIRRVKVLSRVKVVTHLRGRRRPPEPSNGHVGEQANGSNRAKASAPHEPTPSPLRSQPEHAFPVIVIGASTGGPRVIYQILASLPRGLGAAIFVVQHIAEGFSLGMAEWLGAACPLPVALAAEAQQIRPCQVVVVPDKRDMLVTRDGRIHLSDSPLLIQRPSIDIVMQAVAEVYGQRSLGVLLTGMGRDGAYGMQSIRRRGGYTIAQDEASCAIYGMPRAAIQLGAVSEVLPPPQIAARLVELVERHRPAAEPKP
jgi:two-component system, chemotaxis family, protein-glutamate methylesterase/glutaminase